MNVEFNGPMSEIQKYHIGGSKYERSPYVV